MLVRKRMFLAVAAIAVLATGCYKDTAQSTLGEAYKAACKGDLVKLDRLLTGDALAQFGTKEGADAVCKRVSAEQGKKLKLDDRRTAESSGPDGRANHRTYSVDVLSDERVVANATVECAVSWQRIYNPGTCYPRAGYPYPGYPYPPYPAPGYPYPRHPGAGYPYPNYPYPGGYCTPGTSQLVDDEDCKVAALKD